MAFGMVGLLISSAPGPDTSNGAAECVFSRRVCRSAGRFAPTDAKVDLSPAHRVREYARSDPTRRPPPTCRPARTASRRARARVGRVKASVTSSAARNASAIWGTRAAYWATKFAASAVQPNAKRNEPLAALWDRRATMLLGESVTRANSRRLLKSDMAVAPRRWSSTLSVANLAVSGALRDSFRCQKRFFAVAGSDPCRNVDTRRGRGVYKTSL